MAVVAAILAVVAVVSVLIVPAGMAGVTAVVVASAAMTVFFDIIKSQVPGFAAAAVQQLPFVAFAGAAIPFHLVMPGAVVQVPTHPVELHPLISQAAFFIVEQSLALFVPDFGLDAGRGPIRIVIEATLHH